MKKITRFLIVATTALGTLFLPSTAAIADETPSNSAGMTISLMPVSKILQISSNSTYDETMTINNGSDSTIRVEVHAAPYSYAYSSDDDSYRLGFSNENSFTQISRWISIMGENGEYTAKPVFSIPANSSITVHFRISTPNNIPSGGQYAVIFARTISDSVSGGIRTEASPGIVIYGRSTEGEAKIDAEISDLKIETSTIDNKNSVVATAKVKNTGNLDFNAIGTLKVEPVIGSSSYESPATSGRVSVIPESELTVSDAWVDIPSFGIFKATWTVTVSDEITETIESTIVRIPFFVIFISITLLTFLIIWSILRIRRRKERRSRLAV